MRTIISWPIFIPHLLLLQFLWECLGRHSFLEQNLLSLTSSGRDSLSWSQNHLPPGGKSVLEESPWGPPSGFPGCPYAIKKWWYHRTCCHHWLQPIFLWLRLWKRGPSPETTTKAKLHKWRFWVTQTDFFPTTSQWRQKPHVNIFNTRTPTDRDEENVI